MQKLQERTSVFEKAVLTPKAKEKWRKVLKPEYMSSEESTPECDCKAHSLALTACKSFFRRTGYKKLGKENSTS